MKYNNIFFNFWFKRIEVKEKDAGNLCKNIAKIINKLLFEWFEWFESSEELFDIIVVVKIIPSVKQWNNKPKVVELDKTEKI